MAENSNLVGFFSIMKMYVGNMPFSTTKEELETFFSQYGSITDIHIPQDRETKRAQMAKISVVVISR